MGKDVTIGGERLGAGKRMKAYMGGYERSTHDLSYLWRSTMSAGTLVPFMTKLALPGDTFDIKLDCDIMTHPTIGPLFGQYKVQLDVFQIPIRLYQAKLHMNMINIGNNMQKVPLPQIGMEALPPTVTSEDVAVSIDNSQINPSSIFAYLGIRGLAGKNFETPSSVVTRRFNALTWLSYWDIYKQYYANKQEEIGAVIHRPAAPAGLVITTAEFVPEVGDPIPLTVDPTEPYTDVVVDIQEGMVLGLAVTGATETLDINTIKLLRKTGSDYIWQPVMTFMTSYSIDTGGTINFFNDGSKTGVRTFAGIQYFPASPSAPAPITIETFDLANIDTMKLNLLAHTADTPYVLTNASIAPYGLALEKAGSGDGTTYSKTSSQEGLGLKTYNSDLFNNWISTEWIDGVDGISAITAVDTTGDSFTIDQLNLQSKIYVMLNRIAISGGSYDDWLEAVYMHERPKSAENPMYMGGLIKNLVFQEVVSNAATEDEPLGTLAGRGRLGSKNKGGTVVVKADEPSYIMGIISLTPMIDYSQGNDWDTNLKTMRDLHAPALDEIGYQDLITDQMAWWDTRGMDDNVVVFRSAGKQPAWINYMTSVNKVLGNFADEAQQMFMVLNRKYEPKGVDTGAESFEPRIKDLTTYIDPSKFNHIFADTRLDAQNFWVQVSVDIEARRKMSAKIIPNL